MPGRQGERPGGTATPGCAPWVSASAQAGVPVPHLLFGQERLPPQPVTAPSTNSGEEKGMGRWANSKNPEELYFRIAVSSLAENGARRVNHCGLALSADHRCCGPRLLRRDRIRQVWGLSQRKSRRRQVRPSSSLRLIESCEWHVTRQRPDRRNYLEWPGRAPVGAVVVINLVSETAH